MANDRANPSKMLWQFVFEFELLLHEQILAFGFRTISLFFQFLKGIIYFLALPDIGVNDLEIFRQYGCQPLGVGYRLER
jgi:hypothetical protein